LKLGVLALAAALTVSFALPTVSSAAMSKHTKELVAGTKKEGALVFRSHSINPEVFQEFAKAFRNEYGLPGHQGAAPAMKGYWISAMASYFGIAYNREMTGRDLSSWDDLLDPQIQGQAHHAGRFCWKIRRSPWADYSLVQAFLMLTAVSLFRRWAGTSEIEG
jgi:hypothetical protein